MSDAAQHHHDGPHGPRLLSRDFTDEELDAAPVLASGDSLIDDDLTSDEFDAFLAALTT